MSDKTTEAIARIERLARTMVGQDNSKGDLLALAREILAAARGAAEGRSLPDGQRVSIVFEQGANVEQGTGFAMYVEGVNREMMARTPRAEWPTATFWAWRCFEILQDVVGRTARGKALSDG